MRILTWLASLLVVLLTLAALAGLGWRKYQAILAAKATPPHAKPPVAIIVSAVKEIPYRPRTTMIGTIMASQSITLSNEIAGTVRERSFESGGTVEKGQLLLRLDTTVEQAQLDAAQARLRLAQSTLGRLQSIPGQDAISKLELDEAVARRDEAKAVVAELSAMIARRTIKAPFRARVGLTDTLFGHYLPSGTTITTLQSLEPFLIVEFMLPQDVGDIVQIGDPVDVSGHDMKMSAKVIAFDAIADRGTRNLKTRARIDSPPAYLQPGDSVRVAVEYGDTLHALAVPVQSLRRSPTGSHVFVVEADSAGLARAKVRAVTVGPSSGEWVRILSGLQLSDRVAADGSFKLLDGDAVMEASGGAPNSALAIEPSKEQG